MSRAPISMTVQSNCITGSAATYVHVPAWIAPLDLSTLTTTTNFDAQPVLVIFDSEPCQAYQYPGLARIWDNDADAIYDKEYPVAHLDLDNLFTYHRPFGDQGERYDRLRAAAKEYAQLICELTPESAEQTLAVRAVHSASMLANAAIACNEKE